MTTHRFDSAACVILLSAGLTFTQTAAAEHAHMHDDAVPDGVVIGAVDFQASCDEDARVRFDQALGLMHHMMYVQARAEFAAITEAAPDCAMAHWGVATTRFQPLWPERPATEQLQLGWQDIERARAAEPASERERLLIEATAGFFREPESGAYWERIQRWADGMAAAHQATPDDLDTAALYALSLLTLALQDADRRAALHDEAEALLRAVWKKETAHPGAIHYSIHATDVDGRAENALDLVESYSDIAPEVPHALHMPSHIYVRLGDWPKVIDWNRRSAEAALRDPVNGAVSLHYIHAMDYMLYGYLQQGEDAKAKAVFKEAMGKERHQPSFASAFHAAAIPARLALERGDWEQAAGLEPRQPEYLPWDASLWAEGLTWFARGIGGVRGGDLDVARAAEERLKALRDAAREAGEGSFATYIEVDRKILSGWIARHGDDHDAGVALMTAAAKLEGTVEKHPISPGSLLPPNEALGDLLMDLERPAEALTAYRRSDEIWPGRFNTLLGAARAANAAGDDAAAGHFHRRLIEVAGDSSRPVLDEIRKIAQQ